jgi:hypothetical protein
MSRLDGLEANLALLAAIEPAARQQLRTDLAALAGEVLRMQRELVPQRTGALANALQISEQVDLLRMRIGLTMLRRKAGRGGIPTWYGVIVEYGRTAGEALVTRRKRTAPKGKSKHANPGGYTTYQLHWTGLAPRPFIHIEPKVQSAIDALRERFWDAALHRAESR